jgi:hypothetical protein
MGNFQVLNVPVSVPVCSSSYSNKYEAYTGVPEYLPAFSKRTILTVPYCTAGWVDIGTVARVPLMFVVYLKESRDNYKKLVWPRNRFSVGLGHTVQYTTYIRVKLFVHNLDAQFYIDFKTINLPK